MHQKCTYAILCCFLTAVVGCSGGNRQYAEVLTGGNVARGSSAISRYGCGSCHTIHGISGARGLVGPPLSGMRDRVYVAGMLPNTPENLERWIQDPLSINPGTAMPKVGLTHKDAADIVAYLYSLN
ncbi:MAG TPA: c-type cytochrome [Bryobacteraceae bacterium]|nr:c-type cytochrome [Bryobacteraceae bacterium]